MASSAKKEKLISKLKTLNHQAAKAGHSKAAIREVFKLNNSTKTSPSLDNTKEKQLSKSRLIRWSLLVGALSGLMFGWYQTMDPKCIVGNNLLMLELSRPAVSCDLCRDLNDVPTVDGDFFTKEQFLKDFAYNGIPLLVKGGAKNWTALTTFNFKYMKDLFELTPGALDLIEFDCQFFPYKTDFSTMREVFNMSEQRSRFSPGEKEWYVGWSNCNSDVSKQLRKHYKRPEFLPDDSESSNLDWLFMGGFGGGADVHIDYVQRPSWQAMIAGKKSWKIVPSPECDSVCKQLNATMEKGDIILVDTNMWYHSTYIHPGEMSITIGSEYD